MHKVGPVVMRWIWRLHFVAWNQRHSRKIFLETMHPVVILMWISVALAFMHSVHVRSYMFVSHGMRSGIYECEQKNCTMLSSWMFFMQAFILHKKFIQASHVALPSQWCFIGFHFIVSVCTYSEFSMSRPWVCVVHVWWKATSNTFNMFMQTFTEDPFVLHQRTDDTSMFGVVLSNQWEVQMKICHWGRLYREHLANAKCWTTLTTAHCIEINIPQLVHYDCDSARPSLHRIIRKLFQSCSSHDAPLTCTCTPYVYMHTLENCNESVYELYPLYSSWSDLHVSNR